MIAVPVAFVSVGLYLVLTGDVVNSFARFYILDVLLLAAAFTSLVLAKRYSDEGRSILSRLSLIGFGSLTCLAFADQAVLMFRYDTTGVAVYSVTLQNWHNTFVRMNRDGFWERDFDSALAAKGDDWLVTVVGDSFTYGFGVKGKEKRFSDRMEQGLRLIPGQENATVLNLGWPGSNTTDQETVVKKFGARLRADAVLICYLANDIKEAKVMRRQHVSPSSLENVISKVPSLGFLYLKAFGGSKYQRDGMSYMANLAFAYNDKETLDAHLAEVQQILGAVKATGARPVFVMLPFPHLWTSVEPAIRERAYTSLRAAATAAGALVVDLTPIEDEVAPADFQLNPADSHPNEKMHALMAERILKRLIPYLTEAQPDKPLRQP